MVVVAMESDVRAIAKTSVDEVCATAFVVPVLLGRSGVRCWWFCFVRFPFVYATLDVKSRVLEPRERL